MMGSESITISGASLPSEADLKRVLLTIGAPATTCRISGQVHLTFRSPQEAQCAKDCLSNHRWEQGRSLRICDKTETTI